MSSRLSRLSSSAATFTIMSVFTLMAACGGGGGGSSSTPTPTPTPSPSPSPTPMPTGNNFTLNGAAAKGLILGGAVSVVDPADETDVLTTGTTSTTDGSYNVSIPASAEFSGPFVKVIVTGGTGATMICDAPSGCAPAGDFGDAIAIGNDVSISALVPAPANGATSTVNVTALTDMAAALAGGSPTEADINNANGQVASLFGLISDDLSGFDVVDIADGDADASDADSTLAAIISGGILEAALENPGGIGAALAGLSEDFASNSGQLIVNEAEENTAVITLEEILEGARAAADATPLDAPTVSSADAQLAAKALTAGSAEDGTRTDASVSPSSGAADLEQAKAFIADLQLIQTAVENDGSAIDDFLTDLETDFGPALDPLLDDISYVIGRIGAIGLTYYDYEEFFVPQEGDSSQYLTFAEFLGLPFHNIDVSSVSETQRIFTISPDPDSNPEDFPTLNITVESETIVDESSNFDEFRGDDSQAFSGTLKRGDITATLSDGNISFIGQDLDGHFSSNNSPFGSTYADIYSESTSNTVVDFDLKLESSSQTDLSFDGSVELGLIDFAASNSYSNYFSSANSPAGMGSIENDTYIDLYATSESIAQSSIGLIGKFSNDGQTVEAAVHVEVDDYLSNVAPEVVEDALVVTFDNGVITETSDYFTPANIIVTFELLSFDAALSEIATIEAEIENNPDTDLILVNLIETESVSESVLLRSTSTGFRTFINSEAFRSFTNVNPTEDFYLNPPTNVIDYYNAIAPDPSFVCAYDTAVYFINIQNQSPLSEDGVGYDAFSVAAADDGFECFGPTISFSDMFYETPTQSISSVGDNLISIFIQQDIIGIDPEDTNVSLSAFGGASQDDEASANLSFVLEFAGRRFATSSLAGLNFDDGLTEPLSITNQDGITMTITPDAETGVLTGTLSKDGIDLATIAEADGVPTVTFTDGAFVSLQ